MKPDAPESSAAKLPPITAEELERRRTAQADARWAAEVYEMNTEGRTPRPFRTNPHE